MRSDRLSAPQPSCRQGFRWWLASPLPLAQPLPFSALSRDCVAAGAPGQSPWTPARLPVRVALTPPQHLLEPKSVHPPDPPACTYYELPRARPALHDSANLTRPIPGSSDVRTPSVWRSDKVGRH